MLSHSSMAQLSECGTRTGKTPIVVDTSLYRLDVLAPQYIMKIFVHVIANDNGLLRAVADSSVFRQLENMRQFYAPQNICFILAGIEQINSTDLNTHNTSTEEAELLPFMVPGVLNIFIHRDLFDSKGSLNGMAYQIPNYYMSVSAAAIESIDNRSTTAHEMGHCLGLYHTFETAFGTEEIPRAGACLNCSTTGDLLCDTEADPHSDTYDTGNWITADCDFIGTRTRDCLGTTYTYNMNPHNIMAYGRRACRDVFTSGQGSRARAIINLNAFLTNRIAAEDLNVTSSSNISSGITNYVARNTVQISAPSFVVSNTARLNLVSTGSVVLMPGVTLAPTGADAYASVTISTLCQ